MGASGSGKSTLMNILGCLDRPTSGKYCARRRGYRRPLAQRAGASSAPSKLGFVFQSFNLLPRTTAVNNVLMPLDYSPDAPQHAIAEDRAMRLLNRVGLAERLDHVPSQMSGGQQQRVAIARSLVNEPDLLLADEPTGNLDSKTSVEILEMFQQLNASGITVILVTHDPKVAGYAHRTIRVVDGLIEEDTATAATPKFIEPGPDHRGDSGHGVRSVLTAHGHRKEATTAGFVARRPRPGGGPLASAACQSAASAVASP